MDYVKWIKITTDIFDDEKMLLIDSMPEADSIIVVWFKLLSLAGKQNNSGVFIMGNKIAYNDKMLATIFRREEAIVQLALQTFEQFGMIELIDGVITIPNWGKHQNLDQLQSKKEYMRQYMKEYRKKQALITSGKGSKVNSKTNSKANVRQAEEERDKEKIKNKKRKEEEKNIHSQQIAEKYAALCPSLPPLNILSDSIKTDLLESIEKYGLDKFDLLFKKAEASSFLKGENKRNWVAAFDWLIKAENMAKVLNGNFDNKEVYKKSDSLLLFEQFLKAEEEKEKEAVTIANNEDLKARAEALKEKITG